MNHRIASKLLMVAIGLITATVARADEIQWRTNYAAAMQEAQEKSKPLLIDVSMDPSTCVFCRKLDETTFRDPAIVGLVNSKYIPLRVMAGQDPNGIIKSLHIASFPTIVFAHPQGGNVLFTQIGYLEAAPFMQLLQTHADSVTPPPPPLDWMDRDLQTAQQAVGALEFARALWLLKGIVQVGKDRPAQLKARQMLQDIEQQATTRLDRAKQLLENGQNLDAMEAVIDVIKTFSGTQAAGDADKLVPSLRLALKPAPVPAASPPMVVPPPQPPPVAVAPPPQTSPAAPTPAEQRTQQRMEQAREFLAQAREDFSRKQYHICLSRCDVIATYFPDLPEAREALRIVNDIRANPEYLGQACSAISDQLGLMYLNLAETWMKRKEPQQAVLYLERVLKICPGSRHAEQAQVRLSQIQGQPTQPVDFKTP